MDSACNAGQDLGGACSGGNGGPGGTGGIGGGGRGGHAIGIAITPGSSAPSMMGLSFTQGAAGQGGMGDDSSTATHGPDGARMWANVQGF